MSELKNGRPFSGIWDSVRADGYATVRLDTAQAQLLRELYEGANQFFAMDASDKLRHSTARRNAGYRTYGHAYAQTPEHPDLNDSFLYWADTRDKLPHGAEIESFLSKLDNYQAIVTGVLDSLIDEMKAHYGYTRELPYRGASFIQVNNFPAEPDQELLQESHEDAVFATVIWTSAEGLELLVNDQVVPVTFKDDEVLVMPGSVLTDMTGGEVQPLYHQARNHGHAGRKSIMYFASPQVAEPIEPFIVNDYNRDIDIRQRVIENPQNFFGLEEDFLVP